jgi:hypothetical protein
MDGRARRGTLSATDKVTTAQGPMTSNVSTMHAISQRKRQKRCFSKMNAPADRFEGLFWQYASFFGSIPLHSAGFNAIIQYFNIGAGGVFTF